jgi:hypothetical protein
VAGNGNGFVVAGETFSVIIPLGNDGSVTATGVSGTLSLTSGSATISTPTSAYPDIAVGATQNNTTPYVFTVGAGQPCGQPLGFRLTVTYGPGGLTLIYDFTVAVGQSSVGAPVTYTSTDVPKTIPDNNPAGVNSILNIATTSPIADVNLTIGSLTHSWDGDLIIKITRLRQYGHPLQPAAAAATGFINTVFDDEAATPISGGTPPFTGSFRPDEALSGFDNQAMNGTWT